MTNYFQSPYPCALLVAQLKDFECYPTMGEKGSGS